MTTVYEVPMIGGVYSSTLITNFLDSDVPRALVTGSSLRQRFVGQMMDDGLDGLDIREGDYLVFAQSGWPTSEGAVCYVQVGDDSIVRIMRDIYATEPTLCATGGRYPDITKHRNDFIVNGQLVGVIREADIQWVQGCIESDWGC